ncbi:MAG: leucine-rich repeat domain-containing protein, partial [Oscillospiraceae bacterium]|nr:leucine-rich repeat domain-containing protein [Oscillospiraceae bacterium]
MKKNSGSEMKRYLLFGGIAAAAVICILLILFLGPLSKTNRYERKYNQAEALYMAGSYEQAVKALDKVLGLKETEDAYLLLAKSYLAIDDTRSAEDVLRSANVKFDSDAIDELLESIFKQSEPSDSQDPDVGTIVIAGQEISLDATIVSIQQKGLEDLSPLAQLTKLESLTLTDNRISDLSPLGSLTELSFLQLSGNQIRDLSPLRDLPNLRSLYLDSNLIEDFSPLESMTSLKTLSLRKMEMSLKQLESLREALPECNIYCDENDIVEELTLGGETFMSDVKELNLAGRGITDISVLEKCTQLEKLDLRNNNISNLDALSGLTELNWLCLWNNKIEDIAALIPLAKLRYLDLDGNKVTNLAPLKGLVELEELWLSDNSPRNLNALAELKNLTRLGLKNTELTEEGVEILCTLTKLKELTLEKNDIAATWLEDLERALPSCAITHDEPYFVFKVGDKEYRSTETDTIQAPNKALKSLQGLEEFKKLKRLVVNDNQITDLSPLSKLSNLQELTLGNQSSQSGGNRFSDLRPLSGLTGLRKLLLDNCGVQDISPLAGLTGLRELYLSDNQISNISALAGMTKLETLSLDYTGIEDISALAGLT